MLKSKSLRKIFGIACIVMVLASVLSIGSMAYLYREEYSTTLYSSVLYQDATHRYAWSDMGISMRYVGCEKLDAGLTVMLYRDWGSFVQKKGTANFDAAVNGTANWYTHRWDDINPGSNLYYFVFNPTNNTYYPVYCNTIVLFSEEQP